ncbi:MAG: DNA polymerase III subunit chi [Woeseiaceae bacterium]|nr:DNA polymerase III subunit chi [Woeseiaceae bacterium]
MTRVDFYVLARADEHSRQALACRLAEKAYRLENTVYIHTKSRGDAESLDDLLWTFRDGSFVPHELVDTATDDTAAPVVIGSDAAGVAPRDLLINLCDQIPAFADAFPRVAEVVNADEECRQLSRKRFAQYRDKGLAIQTHKL